MHETHTLAQFVTDTHFADLPTSLIADCKILLLDTIAAGFVGTVQPWTQRAVAMVKSLGGTPEASVFAQSWRLDMARAAFVNGTRIGAFECEPLTGSHASGTVLPAALAVSEHRHANGQTFLTALALGCEVSARIARTAVGLETVRGFHNPGTQGPLAAAAAVGKLCGFDTPTMLNALGLAGSCSAGLLEFAWSGADTKRLHLGRASQLGVESALLAHHGLRGPATVLEGRYGYFNAFSMPPDLSKLVTGLGQTWLIQPPSLKFYPVHVTQQAVVQAIQDFKQEHPVQPQRIRRIAIRGTPHIMDERHAVREPETVMGGQYSLPFTTAVALSRDLSQPLAYNEEAVQDPVIRDLARRVELLPVEDLAHPAPGLYPAEVLLDYDGRSYTLPTTPHKGSPHNPYTWDEVCAKFCRYTSSLLKTDRAQALITAISGLEEVADMQDVARLIA